MIPPYWETAKTELAGRDAIIAQLIDHYPGITLQRRSDAFTTLARSIVGQQISVKAAESVWGRLVEHLAHVNPGSILASAELRTCGLSGRKVEYLQDLAKRFAGGELDETSWDALCDEDLIRALTQIRGIGRWTAEMFLIFQALRPDVFPLEDVGLQRAISLHYAGGAPLNRREMLRISEPWSPWRSVATWYLWRSLDPVPVEY